MASSDLLPENSSVPTIVAPGASFSVSWLLANQRLGSCKLQQREGIMDQVSRSKCGIRSNETETTMADLAASLAAGESRTTVTSGTSAFPSPRISRAKTPQIIKDVEAAFAVFELGNLRLIDFDRAPGGGDP